MLKLIAYSRAVPLLAGAVVLLTASGARAQNRVYLRSSVGQPWGQNSNEAAMDAVFGSGGWSDLRYESVNTASLFSGATRFIFMEGSDYNANKMEAFLNANRPALQNWVNSGGAVLLNAAPNEGDGMNLGFGISLQTGVYSSSVSGSDSAHPIFNGRFGTTGIYFSGNSFGHATVSGGLSALLTSDDTGEIVLGEKIWGQGRVIAGGMTTTNYHSPQPDATTLRRNLLAYADSQATRTTQVPEPGTIALLLAGAAPTALVARRRKTAQRKL